MVKHGTAWQYEIGCRCDECRLAHREKQRRTRANRSDERKAEVRAYQRKYRQRIQRERRSRVTASTLKQRPCVDCDHTYIPAVIEFDHVRGTKTLLIRDASIKNLETELWKGDFVCANCHRFRTWSRTQYMNGVFPA